MFHWIGKNLRVRDDVKLSHLTQVTDSPTSNDDDDNNDDDGADDDDNNNHDDHKLYNNNTYNNSNKFIRILGTPCNFRNTYKKRKISRMLCLLTT